MVDGGQVYLILNFILTLLRLDNRHHFPKQLSSIAILIKPVKPLAEK